MPAIPNVQGPVGLRALGWKGGQDAFLSPAYPVRWENTGLLVAECKHGCREIPGDQCHCGVYAALFPWLAKTYLRGDGAALFLIEGCGKVRIPTRNLRGFRAAQGFVLAAVIDADPEKVTGHDLTAYHGAQYFGVPVISVAEAMRLVKTQWRSLGYTMPQDKGGY